MISCFSKRPGLIVCALLLGTISAFARVAVAAVDGTDLGADEGPTYLSGRNSVKVLPTSAGVHSCMCTPLGTKKNAMRRGDVFFTVSAMPSGGSIASSIGSAMAVPNPFNTARREIRRAEAMSRLQPFSQYAPARRT